ncbi:Putative AC transposase [Linum grandiflorum]
MCITAHFIGVDWKLHKKIINFCEIKSYRGSDIGEAIAICLEEWNLKNIFCITTDNATANDTAIVHLKKKFATWGDSIFGGKYLHMRCVAHILNLIVSDGLEEVDMSVRRVREAVRWVRSSPARILACKKCVVFKQMDPKSLLRLDVATRWNSTYLMLETAEKFEEPFLLLEQSDRAFKYDLIAKRHNNMVIEILNMSEGAYTYDFESGYSMTEYVSSRTELELYLKADREPYDPKSKHMFDILGWWKTNSVKYPILSDIARDILAVPISTVPSESAFSTGGRVLDSFRSSLSLQIVEALICCGDWIRSSKPLQNDDEEDLTVLLDAQDELEDGMLFFLSTLYFLSFYL